MKHSIFRRAAALTLAVLLGLSSVAAVGYTAVFSAFAAEESVSKYAPNGAALVSEGASISISACTNERAGSENSYEMPSETWAKKYLTDGVIGNGGWSCQPYDREMDHTKPVTVTLKLGSTSEVSGVSLFPRGQFPADYEIQVSTDGTNFKTVASDKDVPIDNGEVKTYTFGAEKASYVRLHITERNPATGRDGALAQLGEIAVWGKTQASMKLDRFALELFVGETDQLKAVFTGAAGNPAVAFTSADSSVVSVDKDGKLSAKKLGTTTITATCSSLNLTATCPVTVVEEKWDFDSNINISIFWPPTPEYITDEQYKLIAEAGVTWVMGAGEETLATPENQRKMLELCAKYGLGMTINDGNFGDNLLGKSEEKIAEYVSNYKNVPGAYGFYMRDEPYNPNTYIDAYIALKKANPDASMHLNFLPLGSYGSGVTYRGQLNDWVRLTAASGYPIDYLMFDRYPFSLTPGTMDRAGFFENTRACYEIGLKNNVRTGMYIQTVQQDVAFRRPEASAIRYEMYAALAFGYKQLSFFTWFTPVNRSEPFSDGIIAADGTPNEHYYDIKEINHEILAIGPILAKSDALGVYFTGPDTYGQPDVPEDFFVQPGARRDDVILSWIRHKETGRNYLMVVNNNYLAQQKVSLVFDDAIKSLYEVSRTDGSLVELAMNGQTLELTLAAGDAIFIALPEGFDYYKAPEGQPSADTNLALDAIITCDNSVGSDNWYMYNLNDGIRMTGGESIAKGWRTSGTENTSIVLDFGRMLEFNRVDLFAAGTFFDYGANFPKNIAVSVSADGKTYTEVTTFKNLEAGVLQGVALEFDKQTAQYLRLTIMDMKRKDKYAAINEIEVYCDDGTLPPPAKMTLTGEDDVVVDYIDGENIALGKGTFASSTTDDGMFKPWGWSLTYINDGKVQENGAAFAWTSNVGRNFEADSTEYVGIDLGDLFAVDKVIVRHFGAFPEDYHIDLSADGLNWTTITDVKGAPGGEDIELLLDTPVNARYIRFTATKLRFGGNEQDGYLLQLGDIEAYGKPVCNLETLRDALKIYEAEGGDKSATLYTEATMAMENPLLTQSRANDYANRLLAAVNYNPEPPVEETTPEETESVSEPMTEYLTVPVTEPDGQTTGEVIGSATEDETDAPKSGCASSVATVATLTLLASGAYVLRKRRREN